MDCLQYKLTSTRTKKKYQKGAVLWVLTMVIVKKAQIKGKAKIRIKLTSTIGINTMFSTKKVKLYLMDLREDKKYLKSKSILCTRKPKSFQIKPLVFRPRNVFFYDFEIPPGINN